VRAVAIGSNLHVDDAYSWLVASQPNTHTFLRALAATENTPPLFYVLLSFLPIDGTVWLRLPAAVPGVLLCAAVYLVARRRLGLRVALVAALAVAVSPFLVTYSDLARGFMLADLALLVALWAAVRLCESESPGRWALFAVTGAIAVYTEYDSLIFLGALAAGALAIGRPSRIRMVIAGMFFLVALAPWVPQMVRAQHQVGITKLDPQFGATSLLALRNSSVILALGEHGGSSDAVVRWLEFGTLGAIAAATGIVLARDWPKRPPVARQAILLIAIATVLTLAGHAAAGLLGAEIFTQRYMTILIPLGALLVSSALVSFERSGLVAATLVVLALTGIAGVIRRSGAEYEPSFAPIRALALAEHPRTILTNTPLTLFYLRMLHPHFDRPSNLGMGLARGCARPCLIVDDTRVYGGTPRQPSGVRTVLGPFVLTLERRR
jgi:hypothetical protein